MRRPVLAPGGRFYALGPGDEYSLDGAVYVQEWFSEAAPGRLTPCLAELPPVAFARCAALSSLGDRLVLGTDHGQLLGLDGYQA